MATADSLSLARGLTV